MMQELFERVRGLDLDRAAQWKAAGGKVVGYTCVFTPVEIIEAAGLLPFRIRGAGNAETEMADARLSRFNCSFCRSCLQLGLDGTFDFLDGLIETNGCDQLRGMFENWQYARPVDFFHYLKGPHFLAPESVDYFANELRLFAEALDDYFGVKTTDADLAAATAIQARIREKLALVYGLREAERPAITGTETLALILAGSAVPAKEFEELLDDVLKQRTGHDIGSFKARILLGGSATDEVEFVGMIEEMGGAVVTDTLCFGTRAFWPRRDVVDDEPYRALAELYLRQSMCPRMYDQFPDRLTYLLTAAERARVDGVILVHNKFCDVHGIDNALLRLRLREKEMPVLCLEKEYGGLADLGRMRTRVQAFLERIGERP
ncbi:MAG: 2-hydroxyacyl-CoA dehydratase family protein [Candidatus Lernaella stagnicola]|nr:2-hydroxyacyl-CoA dehydratase family protein [Candidatus Lernaella stagnicola]